MQKKGANISLKGYDDIFSTDQSRAEAQQERVQEIPHMNVPTSFVYCFINSVIPSLTQINSLAIFAILINHYSRVVIAICKCI